MAYRPDQDSEDYKAGYSDGLFDAKRTQREWIEVLMKKWRNKAHAQEALSAAREIHSCADDLERVLEDKVIQASREVDEINKS